MARLFEEESGRGPAVTDELVRLAEERLGVRLPPEYVALLRTCNGGRPLRRCYRTLQPTSWAPDHIEIESVLGVGYEDGIDGRYGSRYLIHEWGYPDIGVVICDTPSGGHDAVMLDYSAVGASGRPRVVYVDDDRSVQTLATTFDAFWNGLTLCSQFRGGLD